MRRIASLRLRTALLAATSVAVAVAVPVGAAAPAASAPAPQLGDDTITVHDDEGASVSIERSPFRLVFRDAQGQAVLAEVPGALPVPSPATGDIEPGGFDITPELAPYAPLSFEVGGERNVQHPGGLWTGNRLIGGRVGVMHTATEVESATVTPDGGVELAVGTTDPLRTLTVTVTPDKGSALRVRAALDDVTGVTSFTAAFGSEPGERFHGFGGRHNLLDHRGEEFYNWVEEEFFGARELQPVVDPVPGSGGDRYKFPNGPHSAYYVQNLFMSSKPYGFLLNETVLTRWRMASDREDAWQVTASDDDLDYTVAIGQPQDVIRSLTEINGRHRLPPEWAQQPILKRNVRQGNDSPAQQQGKILADLDTIERLDLDLGGYIYESWDTLPEDFIRSTNARLMERGIHPIGYVRAYVNDDGNFDPEGLLQEAIEAGAAVENAAGLPFVSVAVGPAILIDFTKPDAVAWWEQRKIRKMLDLGFDGFMQDFGEQVNDDMRFHGGQDPKEMHNLYPRIYHSATREILDRYEAEHPERGPIWMYTRTGFSGRPGSAADEAGNFPGDMTSDWQQSSGLPASARDMLNRQVGGLFGFTTDIGGYFDQFGAQTLDAELFTRWLQWSALTPYFRLHNSSGEGTKMPWDFDEATLAQWKKYSALHVQALPYLRTLWEHGRESGMPVVRPLWLAFPGDDQAAIQDQEWMVGDDVLVAPVVAQGATEREVYFPTGCWRHGETGEQFTGPASTTVAAPLEQLPYFFRCDVAGFDHALVRLVDGRPPPALPAAQPAPPAAQPAPTAESRLPATGASSTLLPALLLLVSAAAGWRAVRRCSTG